MTSHPSPKTRRGDVWSGVQLGLRLSLAAGLLLLLLLDWAYPLPLSTKQALSTVVVARDGSPLRAFADAQGIWRYPMTSEQVSPLYLQALLGYEDRWFWRHPGINPVAMLRAGTQMLSSRRIVSGGSTLTMQVARIIDPTLHAGQTRAWLGKLRQILRALQLEAYLSKHDILTLYLERAPFGGPIEGVEAASWAYLGKSATQLSHAEAALLAVLPQAPSRLRPDRHPEHAQRARDKLLARMASRGLWPKAVVDDASLEPVIARRLQQPMQAALLAQRLHTRFPEQRRIVSTLDAEMQRALEDRLAAYFSQLPERTSAALLVVDNASMQARAYVGSLEFADKNRLGHVDMVQAWRSPGSTLKPFLYGMAIDDGLIHSESLLVDAPQAFSGYRPGNFDAAFGGPVSASEALRRSLNVPAVDLLDRVGSARFAARLAHAGIDLRFPSGASPNLSLILGGTAARLEDLVGGFAALSRAGISARVRYTDDVPLLERRLLSPGAAWMVHAMLASEARPGERAGMFDTSTRPRVAWKTGTSYGFRDAWAIGSTASYTVGVWVGRPDGTPLPGQYGAITALPLLFDVIDSLPRRRNDALLLAKPENVIEADICWPLGTTAQTQAMTLCKKKYTAWGLDGIFPPTLAERQARLWSAGIERFETDAHTGLRLSADCQKPHQRQQQQLARWPVLVTPWLPKAWREAATLPALSPDCVDDGRAAAITLQIDGVADGIRLSAPPGSQQGVKLALRALGNAGAVQWLLDGRWIGETQGAAQWVFELKTPGKHTLTALADDGAWDSRVFMMLEMQTTL